MFVSVFTRCTPLNWGTKNENKRYWVGAKTPKITYFNENDFWSFIFIFRVMTTSTSIDTIFCIAIVY